MENNEINSKEEIGFEIIIDDDSDSHKKKKRGIAGFFQKIGNGIANWWRPLKKWKKVLISVLTSLVALLLIAAIIFFSMFNYNYKSISKNPDDLGFTNVIDSKIVNVALFGIDTRSKKSFSGNSDSIMVLSINTETKQIKIVSIMRDSLVKIESNGKTFYRKINSAYCSGGPELAIKTINQNFGLDISEYATVNFYGMAEIIDAVGGIDVEFTRQEVTTTHKDGFNGLVERLCKKVKKNPSSYYIRKEGKYHVNGIQAVAYSRIRKFINIWGTNDDFGRTDRQRYVMEQLFNKAIKLDKSKYVKLAKALIPYTETSLSYKEIMGLAYDVLLNSPTFEESRMPLSEYQMRAPYIPSVGSCVYYDLDFATKVMHEFFYNNTPPEEYVKANGVTKNDWYGALFGGGSKSSGKSDKDSKKTEKDKKNNTSTTSKPQKPKDKNESKVESSQPETSSSEITSSASSQESTPEDSSSETTESTDSSTPESEPTDTSEQTTTQ